MEDTAPIAATPTDRVSRDPQGATVMPGTCFTLTRSQLECGETKKMNPQHKIEGKSQNQDDTFSLHL